MTSGRGLQGALQSWLHEDRHEDATRILHTVLDGVGTTPQRSSGGTAWRFLMNNNIVRVGLAAAAVVVIAIIAINLLPGTPAPGSQPSPSPSAVPSEAPSTSTDAGLPVGSLVTISEDPIPIHLTVPAPGWTEDESGALVKDGNGAAPDGAYIIGASWVGDPFVPSDPCGWKSTMPDTPATTLDEIVAALESQATRNASAPLDATADGHPAKVITMEMPAGVDSASNNPDCDEQKFCTLGFDDPAECYMWYQQADQIDQLWIVDIDGVFHFVPGSYFPETPAAVVEEIGAILGSMTFGD